MEETIRKFVEKWSLDSGSQDLLSTLPEGVLREVVGTFDPPPDTRNMNAKLKTFVRSKGAAGGPPQQASVSRSLDRLGQFAQTWGIDARAMQMLRELPHEVCAGVIEDFAPAADTQNTNAKLIAFIRNRMKDVGHQQAFDPVADFVAHWGVDQASEALLRSLHPQQVDAVMMEFNPGPGTQNVSGKLVSFLRSVSTNGVRPQHGKGAQAGFAGSGHGGGGGGYGRQHRQQQQFQDPLTAFAQHWGLDEAAEQAIRTIPPALQESVMAEFSPPPDTLNASGKLIAFMRGKMAEQGLGGLGGKGAGKSGGGGAVKRPRADPIAGFIMHWGLDAEAQQLLYDLPWDVQEGVMQEFMPPPGTQNYSGKFVSFLKKRLGGSIGGFLAKGGGKQKGPPDLSAAPDLWWENQRSVDAQGGLGGIPPRHGRPPSSQAHVKNDEVGNFVQHWGLDATSEDLVRSLPEDILVQVLDGFQPQAGTRNPNAKLATWVRSLRQDEAPPAKRARNL